MFLLEIKQTHIVKEPQRKNCTHQTCRWKQIALCEERQPLQNIIDNDKTPDNWRITQLPH